MGNLVDRLGRKEEDALVEVMNQYGDYLLRMAFLLVKDHQRAEEAVQDTFITAFEKINQLKEETLLKSWLTTITINHCRGQMRTWSYKHIIPNLDGALSLNKNKTTTQGPEIDLLEMEWNQQLTGAIHTLDYKYREVITLFYFNELKISEIASLTKTKENTIKSRLKRAKKLLKASLMEKEETGDGRKKANQETT